MVNPKNKFFKNNIIMETLGSGGMSIMPHSHQRNHK